MHLRPTRHPLILLLIAVLSGCEPTASESTNSSGPPELVNTETRPTNKQWKGIWSFQDESIFFSNQLEGGRLNGIAMDQPNHFKALITAENYPINPSPWYAFKVWSVEPVEVTIQLTYTDAKSRYYPKVSVDGEAFIPMDSSRVREIRQEDGAADAAPESIEMRVSLSPDTLWIAAQELWTSSDVDEWMNGIVESSGARRTTIGSSREGRPLWMMEVGNDEAEKGVLIISRQHPPEVTGFLAMKSFIETLAGDSEQATAFRETFKVFNVPLMNPDGVDNGNWRHNTGGIDLNRDWQEFNQPETRAVRGFLNKKKEEGFSFSFASDFHSTYYDIYYPLDSSVVNQEAWYIFDWINKISDRLEVERPNVAPSKYPVPTMVSRNYFYQEHGIPSIVFELGDNTERDFVAEKGKIAAEELMTLLMK